ncbi:MAG: LysR family transcriptional regulator [Clostridia bacterium]|nr:LysR family transcriptional regulator [Clostridia bacterium]
MFKKARYVLAVYKEGSFTKAAESLYISQPCLSAAIKQIESDIGARLFDRSTTSVRPTHIGLDYIKTAEKIVELEDSFSLGLRSENSLSSGRVRVGGSNYGCSYILPRIIEAFLQTYPNIRVEITEGHSSELFEMLKKDDIDIIVDSFDRDPEGCIYTPFISEKIMLAVPEGARSNENVRELSAHPIDFYLGKINADNLEQVSVVNFKEEKFILLKPGNSMYEHAVRTFQKSGVTPNVGLSLDQLSTSYILCAQGGGCAFVTDTIFKYHKFDSSVLLYNIKECGERTFGLAYKKEKHTSRVIKEFVRIAKSIIT